MPNVDVIPSEHFNTVLYTGTGNAQNITGVGFKPDFVWAKKRSEAGWHHLFDAIRGPALPLYSNETDADNSSAQSLTSFNADGFSLGTAGGLGGDSPPINGVSWNWKADTTPSKTYAVTVVSDSGNKYRFDGFGTSAVTLDLQEGGTYKFDQSHSSNSSHPFRFGTSSNAYNYSTGVTTSGTPGNAGAYTQITVAANAPALYYACSSHSGMGGAANTNSTSGSSNFSGAIQSKNSANVDAGFSIVSYTGTGSAATIGHGLSKKPEMILIKRRDDAAGWRVFHDANAANYHLVLDTAAARASSSSIFNNTEPTSSVFTVGTGGSTNASSGTFITYCFHSVAGYSQFGSYTGNGNANGPYVHLGFRARFILTKNSSASTSWVLTDTARSTHNVTSHALMANASTAEQAYAYFDITNNGFKVRNSSSWVNGNGNTIIYMAFAETPAKYSNAR